MEEKDRIIIAKIEAFKFAINIAEIITNAIIDRYKPKHRTDTNEQKPSL